MKNRKFIGEFHVKKEDSKFSEYIEEDWAMYFIERYGQFERADHKAWVLDQVAKILNGSEIVIKIAKWSDGEEEFRISVGKESQEYKDWVEKMEKSEEGEEGEEGEDYMINEYDKGRAP